jgi:hypothetical protein
MPVFETYAARVAAAAKVGAPDVYTYDELPPFLRKQISKIFAACIGPGFKESLYDSREQPNANAVWEHIAATMDKEIPSFLFEERGSYAYGHCKKYLLTSNNVEGVLSLIEICAQVIEELSVRILIV